MCTMNATSSSSLSSSLLAGGGLLNWVTLQLPHQPGPFASLALGPGHDFGTCTSLCTDFGAPHAWPAAPAVPFPRLCYTPTGQI